MISELIQKSASNEEYLKGMLASELKGVHDKLGGVIETVGKQKENQDKQEGQQLQVEGRVRVKHHQMDKFTNESKALYLEASKKVDFTHNVTQLEQKIKELLKRYESLHKQQMTLGNKQSGHSGKNTKHSQQLD